MGNNHNPEIQNDSFTRTAVELEQPQTNLSVLLDQAKTNQSNWQNDATLEKIIDITLSNLIKAGESFSLAPLMRSLVISLLALDGGPKNKINITFKDFAMDVFEKWNQVEIATLQSILLAIANFEGPTLIERANQSNEELYDQFTTALERNGHPSARALLRD